MKNIFKYSTLLMLLFSVCSASCPAESPGGSVCDSKNRAGRTQAVDKPVVIFNNMSGSETNFHGAYWMNVNGEYGSDQYKDSCIQLQFAADVANPEKVKEHRAYIIPLGSDYTLQSVVGGVKIIDFIKTALDSGCRVAVFSHQALRHYTEDVTVKDFVENTLNIDYIGLKSLTVSSGDSVKRIGCPVKGLGDGDPLGLNLMKWLNCTDSYQQYGPLVYYDDLEVFRSKNGSLCPAFDFVATGFDQLKAQITDSAVGIRREFDNGARIVFFSYELLNMTRINSSLSIVLRGVISWLLYTKPGMEDPDATLEFVTVKPGDTKTKTLYISNNIYTDKALLIDNITFSDENSEVFYPVDNEGNNVEEAMEDTVISIDPGKVIQLKIIFRPDTLGSFSRTMVLTTNEPAEDGNQHKVTFIGVCGEDVMEESYLSYDTDELSFAETPIGSSKTRKLGVFNYGNKDLEIIAMKFKNTSSDASFSIPADQMTVPKTIKAKSSITLDVTFTPKVVSSAILDSLVIEATASNGSIFPIALKGSSRDTINSVNDGEATNGLFTMSVSPNPASESAQLQYIWNSTLSSGLVLKLADNLGNIVRTLFDGTVEGGEGSIRIDMSGIASGSYSIIAEINGVVVRLPLVIIR